jgi:hypothetical protein
MTTLTKVQEFYIREHAFKTDSKTLAKEVGATKKEVDAYIKTLPVPEPPKPQRAPVAADFIISKTDGKKNNGVAVMNEAASGWGDSNKSRKGPLESFKHCLAPSKKQHD